MGQSECGKSTHKKEIKRLLKLNYAKNIKYLKKCFVHHRRFYNFVVLKDDSSLSRRGNGYCSFVRMGIFYAHQDRIIHGRLYVR
nr:MAG TPA: hypothetical protein [Caudoviricetes sp.]